MVSEGVCVCVGVLGRCVMCVCEGGWMGWE